MSWNQLTHGPALVPGPGIADKLSGGRSEVSLDIKLTFYCSAANKVLRPVKYSDMGSTLITTTLLIHQN